MKDRSKILFGFVMLLMVVGIIGFSYAIFTTKVEKKGALNIVAGNVSCPIQSSDFNEQNQITLQVGEEREIEVTLTNLSETSIHSRITYSGNNIEVLAADNNEDEIELQSLSSRETRTYTLKLTNNGETEETVTIYGRCGLSNKELALNERESKIESTYVYTYRDQSGANRPNLVEGLIPVYYEDGNWKKADLNKKWYDYNNQEWANAVTVKESGDKTRSYYQDADPGTSISMNDINTMWVWIPRYEYKYTNLGTSYAGGNAANPGAIGINFISGTSSKVSDSDNYKMHPAFTFGNKELTGIWYGKFETSSKESCVAATSSVGNGCDVETNIPQIKPSVTSWRGIRVSTAFAVSQKMINAYSNEYGFSGEEIDTHMSKNSEWGAVTYLSQSKYGKYGNDGEEVYVNNCSSYTTGIAGTTASAGQDSACKNTYDTEAGQKASTTGNITGVYDMSGGTYEYVMGALNDGNGKPKIGSSGFVASGNTNLIPDAKYYDVYTTNLATSCTTKEECYGHALSETAGWYGDYQTFVTFSLPWFMRGGNLGSAYSGVFHFDYSNGSAYSHFSFRLVLVS